MELGLQGVVVILNLRQLGFKGPVAERHVGDLGPQVCLSLTRALQIRF